MLAPPRLGSPLQIAKDADAVVLVLGIDKSVEREGTDRVDTALPPPQEKFAHCGHFCLPGSWH